MELYRRSDNLFLFIYSFNYLFIHYLFIIIITIIIIIVIIIIIIIVFFCFFGGGVKLYCIIYYIIRCHYSDMF